MSPVRLSPRRPTTFALKPPGRVIPIISAAQRGQPRVADMIASPPLGTRARCVLTEIVTSRAAAPEMVQFSPELRPPENVTSNSVQ